MTDQPKASPSALLGLGLSLAIPSVGAVQKYTGLAGLAIYLAAVGAALLVGYRYVLPRLFALVSPRLAGWLAVATLLVLLATFAVVYPIANSGVVGGGTDRDEALNIAVQEILHGRYPYYPRTYLQAPISPLPGSLLLSAPFVLLGNSAYQNIFWIVAFYLLIAWWARDRRVALFMLWTVLTLSPLFWQEFVTGGDLLANSLFVCVFAILIARVHLRASSTGWQRLGAAILLGIGLASRFNYALLVVPVCALIWQARGWRAAAAQALVISATALALTLPFYLYDPAGFSPLHTFRKVGQFGSLLPFAGPLIVALAGLAAALLAARPLLGSSARFMRACALPQSIPIVAGLIFYAAAGRLDYTFPGYGFSFLWFGVLAAWAQIWRTNVLYSHQDALEPPS